jgi:hypothetical protein
VFGGFSLYHIFLSLVVTVPEHQVFTWNINLSPCKLPPRPKSTSRTLSQLSFLSTLFSYYFRIPYENVAEINYLKDLEEKKESLDFPIFEFEKDFGQ